MDTMIPIYRTPTITVIYVVTKKVLCESLPQGNVYIDGYDEDELDW